MQQEMEENPCDAYCYKVLKPMLEHMSTIQKLWEVCDAGKLADSKSRLDKLETEMLGQQQRDTSFEAAIKENKQQLAEQKTQIETQIVTLRKPFQKIGSKYYYIEDKQKLSWFAAAHKCREFGADLLSLSNQRELDALRPKLSTQYAYWVDVNDLSTEGEFLSLTSGQKAPFLNWNSGEPNNAGQTEHCVHLVGKYLYMNDFKCSSPEYFICESPNE
ncbi:hypothetical protein KR222_000941 [Zaprionus bogoriensis]|nr:hypothetical protein KR222_000941 [Zaprionus bogoriensis]